MEYKGKKIEIGDSVQFITGLNEHGENNYGNGIVKSFSGTPKYEVVRHEEIVNVIKKERK